MKFDDLFNEWKGRYYHPGPLGSQQAAEDEQALANARDDDLISQGLEVGKQQGQEAAASNMDHVIVWIQDQLKLYNIKLNSDPEIIRMAATDKHRALQYKQQKLDDMEKQLMSQYLS